MNTRQELTYICDRLNYQELSVQCIEECVELAQALTKYLRFTSNNKSQLSWTEIDDNLQEEVADVLVSIRALSASNLINMKEVEEIANKKLARWVDRLSIDEL